MKKHGLSKHPLYRRWNAMIRRCYEPKNKRFNRYGARGITVCDEWRKNAGAYITWMLDKGFVAGCGLTVERRDHNGPYSPDNCFLADHHTQNNNTSRNRYVATPLGLLTLAQASRAFGIPRTTLQSRLNKNHPDPFTKVCA